MTAPLGAHCAICDGLLADEPCAISGTYHYRRCRGCGTAQLDPQPSAEELGRFYEGYHASLDRGYDRYEPRTAEDFPAKAALIRSLLRPREVVGAAQRVSQSTAPGSVQSEAQPRLLDVGCGSGAFLRTATESGFRAEGIDLSHAATERARAAGLQAHTGDLIRDRPPTWNQAFDAVTLLATIEHLPDPVATLTAARACLAPGGILICDTGLGEAGVECLLPGYSQWYEAPEHLFVFTARGLAEAMTAAGLVPELIDRNWDRTRRRRWLRRSRHAGICVAAYLATRCLLGTRGFRQSRRQSKWPIGRLLLIAARPAPTARPA
jgi:SAM-dependent methyltransferase